MRPGAVARIVLEHDNTARPHEHFYRSARTIHNPGLPHLLAKPDLVAEKEVKRRPDIATSRDNRVFLPWRTRLSSEYHRRT